MFSSNKWNKKEESPSSFWRKQHLISLNSSVFIENLPSFERARANHAKIDAQKGCAMQLNGITLTYEQSAVKLVVLVLKSGTVLYKTHAHFSLLNVTFVCSCLLIYGI